MPTRERVLGQVVVPILLALLTSITTIVVAYLQFVLPKTQEKAQQTAEATAQETAIAEIKARLPESAAVPVAVDRITRNEGKRPLFLVAWCGAAHRERELEGSLGEDPGKMEVVSSVVGPSRINIAIPVPPGWYYKIRETTGDTCMYHGWKL